jgi:hypothetical protein
MAQLSQHYNGGTGTWRNRNAGERIQRIQLIVYGQCDIQIGVQ